MAVTRTARGTATSKTSGTTLQIAAQSLNARDLLVVFLAYDDATLDSVFWGTQQMTLGDAVLGNGVRTRLAWCEADATASRTITATWSAAITAKAMVAESFRSSVTTAGWVWNPDANATNTGNGTAASTAATGAIVGGTESVRVGVVGTEGPSGDTAGTWVEPVTAGQRVGTTGSSAATNVTTSSAYSIAPTAASTTGLSKTGMTSRDWGAAIRSFYWSAPPPIAVSGTAAGVGDATATATLTPAGGGGTAPTMGTVRTASTASASTTLAVGSVEAGSNVLYVSAWANRVTASALTGVADDGAGLSHLQALSRASDRNQTRLEVRYAYGTQAGSHTITGTWGGSTDTNAGIVVPVLGAGTAPAVVVGAGTGGTDNRDVSISLTGCPANSLILVFLDVRNRGINVGDADPDYTMQAEILTGGVGGTESNSYCFSRTLVAGGSDTFTATLNSINGTDWNAIAIAIPPAAPSGSALAVEGTAAGTGTLSGAAGRAISLAGSAAGVAGQTGAVTAARPVVGSAAGVGTATGAVAATRPVAGSTAGVGTATGTVGMAVPVSGSSAGAATVAGAVSKIIDVAGSAAGTGAASGALTHVLGPTGSSASVATVAGAALLTKGISGSAAGVAAASGSVAAARRAVGTAAGAGTATGTASRTATLTGSAAGVAALNAAARVAMPAAGTIASATTVAADLGLHMEIGGQADGTSTITAIAVMGSEEFVFGSADGAAVVDGDAVASRPLAATVTGAATASGEIRVALAIEGTSYGTSTGSAAGAMGSTEDVVGTAAGTSTVDGSIAVQIALEGASAGTSAATSTARTVIPVEGTSAGASTASGAPNMGSEIGVVASAAGTSSTTAEIRVLRRAIGSAAGAGVMAGTATKAAALVGLSEGDSTAAGQMAAAWALHGLAAGSSLNSGSARVLHAVNLRDVVVNLSAQPTVTAGLVARDTETAGLVASDTNRATIQ